MGEGDEGLCQKVQVVLYPVKVVSFPEKGKYSYHVYTLIHVSLCKRLGAQTSLRCIYQC